MFPYVTTIFDIGLMVFLRTWRPTFWSNFWELGFMPNKSLRYDYLYFNNAPWSYLVLRSLWRSSNRTLDHSIFDDIYKLQSFCGTRRSHPTHQQNQVVSFQYPWSRWSTSWHPGAWWLMSWPICRLWWPRDRTWPFIDQHLLWCRNIGTHWIAGAHNWDWVWCPSTSWCWWRYPCPSRWWLEFKFSRSWWHSYPPWSYLKGWLQWRCRHSTADQ